MSSGDYAAAEASLTALFDDQPGFAEDRATFEKELEANTNSAWERAPDDVRAASKEYWLFGQL